MENARATRDAAVQQCVEYIDSELPDFELEGSTRSVVRFEGVLPEVVPCVAHAPVKLDWHVVILVDVHPEVYQLVRLVAPLARCPGPLPLQ